MRMNSEKRKAKREKRKGKREKGEAKREKGRPVGDRTPETGFSVSRLLDPSTPRPLTTDH
jgi:hypothetical protein